MMTFWNWFKDLILISSPNQPLLGGPGGLTDATWYFVYEYINWRDHCRRISNKCVGKSKKWLTSRLSSTRKLTRAAQLNRWEAAIADKTQAVEDFRREKAEAVNILQAALDHAQKQQEIPF